MNALDIVKDGDGCRGCVGSCDDCEYFCVLDRIEHAIYDYCKLETPKVPSKINIECSMDSIGDCPNCGAFVESSANEFRCSVCGQKLKWSEDE